MEKKLIIVESPAKSKTISKLLQGTYEVLATYGHIMEIKQDIKAIDVDNNFAITEKVIRGKADRVKQIIKAAKQSTTVYLAMDGDREGEGIASHVYNFLSTLPNKHIRRIKFYEITKSALEQALANPTALDEGLVDAYNARRTLDFLIGFHVSPILWARIASGLSAGRVQSPSLSIICDRQREIESFKPKTYWQPTIDSTIGKLELKTADGVKITEHGIDTPKQAEQIKKCLEEKCSVMKVVDISSIKKSFTPPLPYRTAKLQRDAYNNHQFSLKRTMDIAQTLYESSLITYMRTDSTSLSLDALSSIDNYLTKHYAPEYKFSAKKLTAKHKKILHAQEAHEAIRPVDVDLTPEKVKDKLAPEAFRLYDMIWRCTVASQMSKAQSEILSVTLVSEDEATTMRASVTKQLFDGWKALYPSSSHEKEASPLNQLKVNSKVKITKVDLLEKMTQPPKPLSQSTLLKRLEILGIGRPSTFASIIDTLQKRHYVDSAKSSLTVSDIGKKVNECLHQYFQKYVDYDFTAQVEAGLDQIAVRKTQKLEFLQAFWQELKATLKLATPGCPQCNTGKLIPKGRYVGCSNYPDCRYLKSTATNQVSEKQQLDRNCPSCNTPLFQVTLQNGQSFVGCGSFPKCKYIEPHYVKLTCSKCDNPIQERYSVAKRSKLYACSAYPTCRNIYAVQTVACPSCSHPQSLKAAESEFLCLGCEKRFRQE
jgi:DNA topoisomerase-1